MNTGLYEDQSEGDGFDFSNFYADFRRRLRQYFKIRGIPEADVDEIIQEVALAICKVSVPKKKQDVEKIIFKIAKNKAVDYVRYQTRKKEDSAQTIPVELLNDSESPWVYPETEAILVHQLLEYRCLSKEQLETLVLYYLAGFTLKEVSAISKVSKETSKSRLRSAKLKLKEFLDAKNRL